MTTLLKSATIIDASSPHHQKQKDILIVNGKISKIADAIDPESNYKVVELDNPRAIVDQNEGLKTHPDNIKF